MLHDRTIGDFIYYALLSDGWITNEDKQLHMDNRIISVVQSIQSLISNNDKNTSSLQLYLYIFDQVFQALPPELQMECLQILSSTQDPVFYKESCHARNYDQYKQYNSRNCSKLSRNMKNEPAKSLSIHVKNDDCLINTHKYHSHIGTQTSYIVSDLSSKSRKSKQISVKNRSDVSDKEKVTPKSFKLANAFQSCEKVESCDDSSDSAFLSLLYELERDLRPQPDPFITDPLFINVSENITANIGSTVVLKAQVKGTQKLDLRWFKSGKSIEIIFPPHRYRFENDAANGRFALIINNITNSEYGLYVCVALNGLGKTNFNSVRLQAKEKRRIESNVLSAAIVADPNVVNFLKDRYSSENGNANIHNDSINNESAHVAKSHYQFSRHRSWFNQAINNNSDETQLAKRGDVTVLKCSTDNGIGSQPDLFSKRNNQGDTIIRGFCENEINERKKSDHNDELKKSWYELLTHANIRQCIENEIFNTTEVELLKISLRGI
ncbi:hypothetical protein GJ496_001612 [Pomphorhynchus laevis]|nr:hypothetical protein GJ496_001612 [Pomphorhynchus laevis]